MSVLITGSTAIRHSCSGFPREPKDVDCLAVSTIHPDFVAGWKRGGGDVFTHPKLDEWLNDRCCGKTDYADPDELYTLKVSHSHWDLANGSWRKHMHDIMWLQDRGAVLDEALYQLLVSVWTQVHGAKKMSMQRDKSAFFADAVVRIYDHDSIHDSVAYGDRALYEGFLKRGESVDMDMAAVRAAPFETQIMLFREEVYATALERLLIPNEYRFSPGHAYLWALRRTITSLTKGWSSRFMIENYRHFRNPYPAGETPYLQRHLANRHKLIRLETP